MDLQVTLPPVAQSISPIMITAPTSHGGTALIQRVMCRGANGLCYGDNMFEQTLSIIDWATSLIDQHRERQDDEETALASALSGNPGKWLPDAAPEFRQHMSSIFSTVYNIPHLAEAFAKEQSRDVWAMIRSALPAPLMSDLLSIFPNGKAVIIHRNPFDTAADLLRDHPDVDLQAFAEEWTLGMNGYLRFGDERVLKLRYEDAIDDAAAFAGTLAGFTGLSGIGADEIDAGSEAELDGEISLNEDQRSVLASACADMLTVHYPELA